MCCASFGWLGPERERFFAFFHPAVLNTATIRVRYTRSQQLLLQLHTAQTWEREPGSITNEIIHRGHNYLFISSLIIFLTTPQAIQATSNQTKANIYNEDHLKRFLGSSPAGVMFDRVYYHSNDEWTPSCSTATAKIITAT